MDIIAQVAMGQEGSKMFHSDYSDLARATLAIDQQNWSFKLAAAFPILKIPIRLVWRICENLSGAYGATLAAKVPILRAARDHQKGRGRPTRS